ncbi:MAG: type 1 glutamine amidotransferase [Planctomycetes bacterium]|nr:type 1 glutamine amidotransferase [Planctomycetota bacterium]
MELRGKRVAVLVGKDFEESEAIYPIYRLKEAGAEVLVAGHDAEPLEGKHGYPLQVEHTFEDLDPDDLDGVVLPGGYGPDHVRRSKPALRLVKALVDDGKLVAAICHAGWVLASAGVLRGREATSFASIKDDMEAAGARWRDEEVVVDGNLVTSRHPGDLPAFMRAVVAGLSEAARKPAGGRRRRAVASRR